jgi:TonB dependent receptor/CarboxypepD_reg-like domain/TonB-dependent Receptor Plug Domain
MYNLALVAGLFALLTHPAGALQGRVFDAVTKQPLKDVLVLIPVFDWRTQTDSQGGFVLDWMPQGEFELLVSAPGYESLFYPVSFLLAANVPLEIYLKPKPASSLGEITVSEVFTQWETNAASETSLDSKELKSLTSGLISDPVRAAQALPGVSGNDDLSSRFALRGAGMERVGFLVEGIVTGAPAHTIQEEQGGGSVSLLNADTVSAVTLLAGAFPAKYGDATAGVLSFELREGSRERVHGKVHASVLNASAALEGPWPRQRGSWLVAVRRSYLGYVLRQLERPGVNFDFTDVQSKLVYRLSARHQVGGIVIVGKAVADQSRNRSLLQINDLLHSDAENRLWIGSWDYAPRANVSLRTRGFSLFGAFLNRNPAQLPYENASLRQSGMRSDLAWQPHAAHQFEAGVYLRDVTGSSFVGRQLEDAVPSLLVLAAFRQPTSQQSFYLQDTWQPRQHSLALTGGLRIERTDANRETLLLPRMSFKAALGARHTLRLGWGSYAQFPNLQQRFGLSGNPQLRAERAQHFNVAWERRWNEATRLTVELYERRERGLSFTPDLDAYRVGQPVMQPQPLRNRLDGNARGIEIALHRRVAARLTGWLTYGYNHTHLLDADTGASFVSDYDQRHTASAVAHFRLPHDYALDAQWRLGSGLPLVGVISEQVTTANRLMLRNQTRLPVYSRLDLSARKHFKFKQTEITLFGESLNALGRNNQRQTGTRITRTLPFTLSGGCSWQF